MKQQLCLLWQWLLISGSAVSWFLTSLWSILNCFLRCTRLKQLDRVHTFIPISKIMLGILSCWWLLCFDFYYDNMFTNLHYSLQSYIYFRQQFFSNTFWAPENQGRGKISPFNLQCPKWCVSATNLSLDYHKRTCLVDQQEEQSSKLVPEINSLHFYFTFFNIHNCISACQPAVTL